MEAPVVRLTEQQRRVLDAYRRRANEGLPPPTYRELCREFGWGSTGTVRDHIRALVYKGLLHPSGRKWRGAHLRTPRPQGRRLPLVGTIVAGRPLASEQDVEREILVPEEFVPRGEAFVLRVSGDSMEGAGILAGDLVVVRQARTAKHGDIVAVTIDGETTLKVLQQTRGKWLLVAANPRYAAIKIESEAVIHGVVTAMMRTLECRTLSPVEWRKSRASIPTRRDHP